MIETNSMDPCLRTFQVSSDLFWGYRMTLDMNRMGSEKDIVRALKADMKAFFLKANLELLALKVDSMDFHLHLRGGIKALMDDATEDTITYICDHSHEVSLPFDGRL